MNKVNWRNSGGRVMFFMFDSSVFYFLILMLYTMNLITFFISFIGISVLYYLNRRGYTIPNALRKLRIICIGKYKVAVEEKQRMNTHL